MQKTFYRFKLVQNLNNILEINKQNSANNIQRMTQTANNKPTILQSIFRISPKIAQYFKSNTIDSNEYMALMIQLLLQSIEQRENLTQKRENNLSRDNNAQKVQNKKHYNVAYIKHNRFLSPTQKRQITPKVTEMIPVSPQKIVIYGKPKVRLDDGFGCPVHKQNCCCNNEEQNNQQDNLNSNTQQKQNKYPSSVQQYQSEPVQYQDQIPVNYEQYLSPKQKLKKKQNKNKKTNKHNQTVGFIVSPNKKVNQSISNRMTSPKSFMRENNQNSQICYQNYTKVQSKIKDLIQRDKKNRQMQKQLQKQKGQIQQIYQRQNKLLILQKNQKQALNEQQNQTNNIQNSNYYVTKTRNVTRNVYNNQNNQSSSLQSESECSVVDLHGHKDQQSRIKCYDCQIQRLRKRKQKAKLAVKLITKDQQRRSKLLQQIIHSSDLQNHRSQRSYQHSQQSHNNSIMINR